MRKGIGPIPEQVIQNELWKTSSQWKQSIAKEKIQKAQESNPFHIKTNRSKAARWSEMKTCTRIQNTSVHYSETSIFFFDLDDVNLDIPN